MKHLFEKPENQLAGHLLGKEVQIEFLSVNDVLAIHDKVIASFGGGPGVRDMGLLTSAVHRPMQAASYEELTAPQAAALLGQALIQNHAFLDGNKRSGFFSMIVMLDQNGYEFMAEAMDIVHSIKGLASGALSDAQFSDWVQRNCVKKADVDAPAADDGTDERTFVVTMARERWLTTESGEIEFDSEEVLTYDPQWNLSEEWTYSDLERAIRERGISILMDGGGQPVFCSEVAEECRELWEEGITRLYRLEIERIDGREPTAQDLRELASELGVRVADSFQKPEPKAKP